MFEVWSVSLAKLNDEERKIIAQKAEEVFKAFIKLMNDDTSFEPSITSATGDKTRVAYRFTKIEDLLKNIIKNDN